MDQAPIPAVTDPALIEAWLTARSVARGLPPPVRDHGGLRVDTNSAIEACRWVFPVMADGLSKLARDIREPLHFLKLCANDAVLRDALGERWQLLPRSYVMTGEGFAPRDALVPVGYRLEVHRERVTTGVHILAQNGALAASGYAAEAAGVFIYDRIVTDAAHRRLGLGRAVMATLASARTSQTAPQILVATDDGRKLYASLGWSLYAPYASASLPSSA